MITLATAVQRCAGNTSRVCLHRADWQLAPAQLRGLDSSLANNVATFTLTIRFFHSSLQRIIHQN